MSGFSRLPAAGKRVFIRTLHPGAALSYHAPMMKSLSIAALAAAILTCAWAPGAGARPVPVNGVLLDSYAAIVNQKVITVGDVFAYMQPLQEQLTAQYAGRELEEQIVAQFDRARDALIESELILQDFAAQGGVLPDRAVENHISTVIHERYNNDRSAFMQALAAERLTFVEWRQQLKDQLVVQYQRQREVQSKILIAPMDLQKAYEERIADFRTPETIRLRTFALPLDKAAAAKKFAQKLREEKITLEQAAEQAQMTDAQEWIPTSDLNEAIRETVAKLRKAKDVADPIELGDQLYVIQLVGRRPARTRPFAEVAPAIERDLRRAEAERLSRIWLDSLRAKYYVQIFSHNLLD